MSTRKGQVAKLSTQTYPVPSIWNPVAFVTRATLPPSFDLVFGTNARYPVQFAEIGTNPFQVRKTALKRARAHASTLGSVSSTEDSSRQPSPAPTTNTLSTHLKKDTLRRTLSGIDPMTPTLSNQKFWARELSPESSLSPDHWPNLDSKPTSTQSQEQQVWQLLVHYNSPLLSQFATPAQLVGINLLGLNQPTGPSFQEISSRLECLSGWSLVPANGEVQPLEFFTLLARRKFPVVSKIRPIHALFCGYEPDYWHEAIGHLAFLTDPEFCKFYQFCGKLVTELASRPNSELLLNSLYQLLWTLMEYGVFKTPQGQTQAFGAALTSSFMALQRLKRGYITTRHFDPKYVLKSGFATEGPIKRRGGKIEFFHITSLEDAKPRLTQWLALNQFIPSLQEL